MDIVHHAFIGGAGYLAATAGNHDLFGFSFVAASVFPDLDVFFMLAGKRFYLRNHQAITHSLLLMPVYALAISALLSYPLGLGFSWALFFGALAGLSVHIVLDWTNTFRIALLLPASFRRFSLDAVFFIDAVAWTLTGLFYLFFGVFAYRPALFLYPLLFAAYIAAKLAIRRMVINEIRPKFAIPSSLNPFAFYILKKDGGPFNAYLYNALTKKRTNEKTFDAVEDKYIDMSRQSQVFKDMQHILRALFITKVTGGSNGTTIIADDIAVRNVGGRFGRTQLVFDQDDRLVDEVANI